MSLLSRGTDTYFAFRFLKLLTTPWEKTDAYELGIIDENGKKLKKPATPDEKTAYSYFHRLAFNVKRLLNKAPGGKSRLASFITALYLIKESQGLTDDFTNTVLERSEKYLQPDRSYELLEDRSRCVRDGFLLPGSYVLTHDIVSENTGEEIPTRGMGIELTEAVEAIHKHGEIHVFRSFIPEIGCRVLFTNRDIG